MLEYNITTGKIAKEILFQISAEPLTKMYPAILSLQPEYILLAWAVVILLFSVIAHEVAHGWIALHFGDHTAERAGRLTLNPLPHIDPFGTILLPGILIILMLQGFNPGFIIGWAKPVPVNPFNFNDVKKGELFVSLAGVVTNLLLAIFGAICFHLINFFGGPPIGLPAFTWMVNINLLLAVFNFLPIPPLDGSKVVATFLPSQQAKSYLSLERYGLLIIFILWIIKIGPNSLLGMILHFGVNLLRSLLFLP